MMPQCFSMMYSPPGGAPGGPEIGATGATGTAAATGTAGTGLDIDVAAELCASRDSANLHTFWRNFS